MTHDWDEYETAARALLDSLRAPVGAISIMPLAVGGVVKLFVFIDRAFLYLSNSVPTRFDGMDVVVRTREPGANT